MRMNADTAAGEAAQRALEESERESMYEEDVGRPFVVAHVNFDPTMMEDIIRIPLNQDYRAKYDQLKKEGYVCYGVYYVRSAHSIYVYSHILEAILAKTRSTKQQ